MRALLRAVLTVVALTLLLVDRVASMCPANGNTRVLYVTTNGANNILSYDSSGEYLGEVIDETSFPKGVQVHKLRAMHFGPEGFLYVASAKGPFSSILALSGNGVINETMGIGCTRAYEFSVVNQSAANPFLDHPYDFEFDPETDALFVANQNSATITRYTRVPGRRHPPRWEPTPNSKFAVGESVVDESGAKIVVPSNSGLFISSWSSSYSIASVRGIALSPLLPRALVNGTAGPGLFTRDKLTMGYYLLVCDVAADMVHVFDAETSEYLYGVDVPAPIQVRFPDHLFSSDNYVFDGAGNQIMKVDALYVYVTSKEDGMAYFINLRPRVTTSVSFFSQSAAARVRHSYSITRRAPFHSASGILEHPTLNTVLVADRTGNKIVTYASPFVEDYMNKPGPSTAIGTIVKRLPDQPEFLMYAVLENQVNIPLCYELSPSGSLRFVALCAAGNLWLYLFYAALAIVAFMFLLRSCRNPESARRARKKTGGGSDASPLLSESPPSYGTSDATTKKRSA